VLTKFHVQKPLKAKTPQTLVDHAQKLHGLVGNAITKGNFFVLEVAYLIVVVYVVPFGTSVLSPAIELALC